MEQWKKIDGYPGYEVSDMGKIRNSNTGRILRQQEAKRPRCKSTGLMIGIWTGEKIVTRMVPRLVAMAFIPNPDGLEMVEHINGDYHDNRVENLRWSDRQTIRRNALARLKTKE